MRLDRIEVGDILANRPRRSPAALFVPTDQPDRSASPAGNTESVGKAVSVQRELVKAERLEY
ncbi:hypothetical protein SAMD00023353_6500570 [Rosellinia necatrix]|uniref:Uncharacterized protein n=1 Tax=Rosellinia necatrix TaxID=77044 RepID=A0A1S8AAI5_ROSNE|nr:hypothetical protein SAMD00023353_6500570 [Rosellinia necatrix]